MVESSYFRFMVDHYKPPCRQCTLILIGNFGSLQVMFQMVTFENTYFLITKGYWDDEFSVKKFINFLVEYYDLKNNDATLLTVQNINEAGGSTLLRKCGGL